MVRGALVQFENTAILHGNRIRRECRSRYALHPDQEPAVDRLHDFSTRRDHRYELGDPAFAHDGEIRQQVELSRFVTELRLRVGKATRQRAIDQHQPVDLPARVVDAFGEVDIFQVRHALAVSIANGHPARCGNLGRIYARVLERCLGPEPAPV